MTGGLGFIGSNLVQRLVRAGANVVVIDALVPTHGGNSHNLAGIERDVQIVVASIADSAAAAPHVVRADHIFNLAGQVSHLDSMEDPLQDLEYNTTSQLAFLELVRRTNPDVAVVYSSTRQLYGKPRYLPVDEAHAVEPVDINGICKYATEQFHLLDARVHGMRACALRITNVYGPRQRIKDDKQGFLGIFVRRALQSEPITVYGDGGQLRDCLHVDDVVSALALAATSPDVAGHVVNLGHPDPLSVREAAETIVRIAGSGRVELVPWPRDHEIIDIGDYYGDYSLAERLLGWKPAITFADGMSDTVEYYREHLPWYL